MRILPTLAIFVLLSSAALADEPKAARPDAKASKTEESLPSMVTVEILNALIGPCKADGTKWDGIGHCDKKAQSQMTQLTSQQVVGAVLKNFNLYGQAAAIMQGMGGSILSKEEKPDPFGTVEVCTDNEFHPDLKHNFFPKGVFLKDTYTPDFPNYEFKQIPLNKGTRLRITLWDKDLTKDDFIGKAELTYDDLVAALKAGKIFQVMVADQTQNQLLFVGISVRPGKTTPSADVAGVVPSK